MNAAQLIAAAVTAVVVLLAGFASGLWYYHHLGVTLATSAPDIPPELLSRGDPAPCSNAPCEANQLLRFDVVPELSAASFFADVRLSKVGALSRVTGRTDAVFGAFELRQNGIWLSVTGNPTFEADLSRLESEVPNRFVNIARLLEVDQFPMAKFEMEQLDGVNPLLPPGEEQSLRVRGALTLHGVTRDVEWILQARWQEHVVTALATTKIRYQDYGISVPKLSRALSSSESITVQVHVVATLRSSEATLTRPFSRVP